MTDLAARLKALREALREAHAAVADDRKSWSESGDVALVCYTALPALLDVAEAEAKRRRAISMAESSLGRGFQAECHAEERAAEAAIVAALERLVRGE